jgi:hypothetical protein
MSSEGTAAATGDTGAAAAQAAATAAAAASATAPWYAARKDDEFSGIVQNRGLDKKTADEAAFEFYKAHRSAEKLLSERFGTDDRSRVLLTPKPDASEAEKNAFYEKLGRPQKPEEYDFKDIKFPDGTELDDNFSGFLRNAAFKANVSKDGAQQIAREMVQYLDKIDQAEAAENSAKLVAEKEALKKSWGPNFEANEFVANQGFKKIVEAGGLTAEQAQTALKALGDNVGAGATAKFLHAAGVAFGEHKYVANSTQGNQGIMSREQATARMAELRKDATWTKAFSSGDVKARSEFDALTAMMADGER